MPVPISTSRRRTGAATAVLATLALLAAGLVATAAPAAAAPPDSYAPKAGATFNKPIGTRKQQYRLFTHINRSINSAPARSAIRMAVFSFSDMRTADNLIAAHRRGVAVKLVFDDHKVFDAQRKLQRALGRDVSKRSFVTFCEKSCRSTSGEMHAKYFGFSRTGGVRHVTMVGSNNMTSHNAERHWSDLTTLVRNEPMHKTFVRWFGQLKKDRAVEQPRIASQHRRNLALIMPNDDDATDGDPALKALRGVVCRYEQSATDASGKVVTRQRRTRVMISTHAWFGPRGHTIGRRVADLAEEGCHVRVFYAKEAFGNEIEKMLRATPATLRTSSHQGVRTHQKLLIVRGKYGGNDDAHFVWTGSHNWTPWALKLDDVILRNANRNTVKAYAAHFNWMFDNA